MPNIRTGSLLNVAAFVTDHLVFVGGTVTTPRSATEASGVIRLRLQHPKPARFVRNSISKKPYATETIANVETYSNNAPNSWSVRSYDPQKKPGTI